MLQDISIARYFLSKDVNHKLFNTRNLISKCERTFYEGNARLNKYLHLAQNIYIAKTGNKLFAEDLYAYDNGAITLNVQENYSTLLNKTDIPNLTSDIQIFLDKIYKMLENATLDELIELSHEDSEWVDKQRYYKKSGQKMDSLAHIGEYQTQYRDVIKVMDRMGL